VYVCVRGWVHACACVGARAMECAFALVALFIQHATHMRHVVCSLSGFTKLFEIISQMARFSGKKLLNTNCVFWLSLQPVFEIVLIGRGIQRDIAINVKTSSSKVPVIFYQILIKLALSRQIFEKCLTIRFHQNLSSGSRVVLCGRTDGRTDRHGEVNSRFSQIYERA
jgi:hypothetical protein